MAFSVSFRTKGQHKYMQYSFLCLEKVTFLCRNSFCNSMLYILKYPFLIFNLGLILHNDFLINNNKILSGRAWHLKGVEWSKLYLPRINQIKNTSYIISQEYGLIMGCFIVLVLFSILLISSLVNSCICSNFWPFKNSVPVLTTVTVSLKVTVSFKKNRKPLCISLISFLNQKGKTS